MKSLTVPNLWKAYERPHSATKGRHRGARRCPRRRGRGRGENARAGGPLPGLVVGCGKSRFAGSDSHGHFHRGRRRRNAPAAARPAGRGPRRPALAATGGTVGPFGNGLDLHVAQLLFPPRPRAFLHARPRSAVDCPAGGTRPTSRPPGAGFGPATKLQPPDRPRRSHPGNHPISRRRFRLRRARHRSSLVSLRANAARSGRLV